MTSDSPGIVLFMDDTLTSQLDLFLQLALSSRYGKMVTLRIWEILGIKTELNTIYDRHQGVLKLSLLLAFSQASSLEQLPNCYAWWISYPWHNSYVSAESRCHQLQSLYDTTVDEFLTAPSGHFLASDSKFIIFLIKPWEHVGGILQKIATKKID